METLHTDLEALMPEPAEYACIGGIAQNVYTADQMREAIRAATERAARLCEKQADAHVEFKNTQAAIGCDGCAAAIRASGGKGASDGKA